MRKFIIIASLLFLPILGCGEDIPKIDKAAEQDSEQKPSIGTIKVLTKLQLSSSNGVPTFWIISEENGLQLCDPIVWTKSRENRSYNVEQGHDDTYGVTVLKIVEENSYGRK